MTDEQRTPGPLGWLERIVSVRAGEGTALVLAFCFHFFILSGYYAVRPVRVAFGVARGADDLPVLYTGTLIAMLIAQPIYGWIVARLPRRVFIPIVYNFFIVNIVLIWVGLTTLPTEPTVAIAGDMYSWRTLLGYVFFVWISVFNLFITSVFWSLMADRFREEQGRRLFGCIAAGGSVGALLGASTAWTLTERIGAPTMLLIGCALLEGAVIVALLFMREADRAGAQVGDATDEAPQGERIGGSALAGMKSVLTSPYLIAIAGLMFLMSVCSTLLYFQQADIVSKAFDSEDARAAFFAKVDVFTNIATFTLQILIVSRLMKRGGVTLTLALLPVITVLGFAALALQPTLWVLVAFQVANRSGRYALMRPAREVLYTVLSREDKYKAKGFNDTFVYRFGDQLGAWGDKGLRLLQLTPMMLAWIGAGVAVAWGAVAVYAGVRHRVIMRESPATRAQAPE
ncbi:MAG: NTP/NDP exchange transporter [Phycisphaerales bacterium]